MCHELAKSDRLFRSNMFHLNLLQGSSFWRKEDKCRNPNFGLVTKARVCKVAGQEGSRELYNILPGVWEGVREWTLTPQGSSTLGVEVPVDSRIFRGQLQGLKFNGLKSSLYH